MLAAFVTLLLQAPTPAVPTAPKDESTVVKANLRLKDVDLGELVARLNVNLPVKLTGKISVDVAADIPLADARTLTAYKVRGKVTVPALGIGDFAFKDVFADINYDKGVLALSELSAKVPDPAKPTPGTISGRATFGVEPGGDLTADLKLTDVPLGEVLKAHPELAGKAAGPVSGGLTFRLSGTKLGDLSAAVADGQLTSPGLTVFDRKLGATKLGLKLRDGVARIADAGSTVEGLPVAGAAALTLSGQYPFEATVNTKPTEVADLAKLAGQGALPVGVKGKVELTAAAKGSLEPLTYTLGGKASAAELIVGTAPVDKVSFDYSLSEKALALSDLRAEAFGGTVAGGGTVPLRESDPGVFKVTLTDLNASALTKAVPSLPLKLDGRLGGTVAGTLPPAAAGKPRAATVAVDVQAPKLRVQGVPTTRLRGKVDYKPGALVYALTGESLGGTFDLDGTYPLAAASPASGPPGGTLRIDRMQFRRLAGAIDAPGLAPLRGRVSLVVRYRYDEAGRGPFGEGDVRVYDFGWDAGDATRDRSDLRAPIRITPDAVDLPEVSGQIAGGEFRGRVRYNIARPDRSFYNLTLNKGDADRLLAPFGAAAGFGKNSKLTVALRGNLGRELRGTGSVTASRTSVVGTDMSDLRVPFEYTFTPGGNGEVTVRDLNAQAAGGRVTGQAVYRWGTESKLEGGFRFVSVSLRQLLGLSVGITAGRFNGRFDFAGRDMKSANDLTGLLSGSFSDPNPFDAPVLRQLQPFLNPGQIVAPFSEGDIRARLAGGVFRVERFTLTGTNLQVFADGTVGLNGRIDLDFKARSGQVGGGVGSLALFGIPAIGPIPLGAIVRASQFLSNRMVLLKVTGTTDHPNVQVNVAALLADEAIRYFLGGFNPLKGRP